jgi:hypothetical protein
MGVWLGHFYRKYGLSYAMLARALVHVVSDVIWAVLIYLCFQLFEKIIDNYIEP